MVTIYICPCCKNHISGVALIDTETVVEPQAGDATICFACGTACYFEPLETKLILKEVDTQYFASISIENGAALIRLQEMVRQVLLERAGNRTLH